MRRIFVLSLGAVLLLVAGGGYYFWRDYSAKQEAHEAATQVREAAAKKYLEAQARVKAQATARRERKKEDKLLKSFMSECGFGSDITKINATGNKNDWTPLQCAAANGKVKVASLLIARGADVNFRGRLSSTPLHEAAWNGRDKVVKLLIQKGAYVNARDKFGHTPLKSAAENNKWGVVGILERAGGR